MARPREPINLVIAKGKKHLTKEEIEKRKNSEIKVDLIDVKPPDYLPEQLKLEFEDYASKLLHIGIMTELDEDCLARYLLARQLYLKYTSKLTQSKIINNIEKSKEIMKLQSKAFDQCQTCANSLGLTISSRCRLVIPGIQDKTPPTNKFSKFIK